MDIKKIILALTVAVSATYAFAQEKAGDSKPAEYEFTVIIPRVRDNQDERLQ